MKTTPHIRTPLRQSCIRSTTLLELVARVGAATPELLTALLGRTVPSAARLEDVLYVHRRLRRLERQGLLKVEEVRARQEYFRVHEDPHFRLTGEGVSSLQLTAGMTRAVLQAIQEGACPVAGGTPEAVVRESAFQNWTDSRNARFRLRQLEREGLIRRIEWRRPGIALMATLSRDGRTELVRRHAERGRRPPVATRAPRLDQCLHHLYVVGAAARILRDHDGDLIRLWGDEDLRSQQRKGVRMSAGDVSQEGIPDGRLRFRDGGGQRHSVDIEILDSKYTSAKIREKYSGLDSKRTLYFATTHALADRVESLGFPRPYLV